MATPGLLHWHAMITVLSPGLLAIACLPALYLLRPYRRWSWVVAGSAAVVAFALGILLLRATWRMQAMWATVPGHSVHSGWIVLGLALLAMLGVAIYALRQPTISPLSWLRRLGLSYLMLVWTWPWWLLLMLSDESAQTATVARSASAQRGVLLLALVLALLAALSGAPLIGQLLSVATVACLLPWWRAVALLSVVVAGLALIIAERVP